MNNNLKRNEICPHCGRYDNRGISIDSLIIRDNKILLVKRGAEPFKGYWATPGGYVEWDESAEDTVKREVLEEVGLTVTSTKLFDVRTAPDRHPKQVIALFYVVEAEPGEPRAGDDAQDLRWFAFNDLPEQMAFDHKQVIEKFINILTTS